MPEVTGLYVYPVKSMQGIPLEKSELTVRGLKYDRNWMVVDAQGSFVTQRQLPKLATIQIRLMDEQLHFTNSEKHSIAIPLYRKTGKEMNVEVWGDRCEAIDEGDQIAEWLNQTAANEKYGDLRLVKMKDSFQRKVDEEYLKGEDSHTAFADGFPFLITTEESLSELNDHLAQADADPVEMNRFRPNIVIKGLKAFGENRIQELISSDDRFKFGIRKPCKRCKITTIDQKTGEISEPKEPLRTLTKMSTISDQRGAFFGQNATLLFGEGNKIKKGDQLTI